MCNPMFAAQVLTHTASQVPSLKSSPHSPSSLAGHSEAELEYELADLKSEASRLQHRLADIQRRCFPHFRLGKTKDQIQGESHAAQAG